MNKVREAYKFFTGVTAELCSGRIMYNQKCDQCIMSWKFDSVYNSYDAKELIKVRKISYKRRATFSNISIMIHNDKFIALCNKKDNQTN